MDAKQRAQIGAALLRIAKEMATISDALTTPTQEDLATSMGMGPTSYPLILEAHEEAHGDMERWSHPVNKKPPSSDQKKYIRDLWECQDTPMEDRIMPATMTKARELLFILADREPATPIQKQRIRELWMQHNTPLIKRRMPTTPNEATELIKSFREDA